MKRAFHAIVHGRVQGVSFRYYTQETAGHLGLAGFVRNLPDGTVEVSAEGEESALKNLAKWLEGGPSHARVDRLDLSWTEPEDRENRFRITY